MLQAEALTTGSPISTPRSLWLHRFAVLLSICTLFLVVAGALVTSNQAGLSVPDWPLSYGQVMPEMKGGVFYEHGHRMIASGVGFLTVILAVWLWIAEDRRWMKYLGATALALVIAQGLLGGLTVLLMLPPAVSIAHACLAQIFFSTTVAIAMFTAPGWRADAELVQDYGRPSLRSLAIFVPLMVLLQVALGAGYRHRVFSIVPHVLGAIVVGTLLVIFAIFVLVQFQQHSPLRRAAGVLGGITIFQILLGIAAYLERINTLGSTAPVTSMVVTTVAHVAGGSLTVAATAILSLQVFRHVRSRQPAPQGSAGLTVTS